MKIITRQSGFSFIELSIAMIVMGTLLVIAMPFLKTATSDVKRKEVRTDLTSAMNALKGYVAANGAFPDFPNDGGGFDIMYQLPTAKLGLQTKTGYQDIIHYEANAALQFVDEAAEAAGQSSADFCTAVTAEIAKLESAPTADDPIPRVCKSTAASCAPATVADQTSVAVVLVSRAKNTTLDLNNLVADGVYENGGRGESDTYDDVMKTLTLYEAADFFGCSAGVAGNWGTNWTGGVSGLNCGADKPVVIHNGGGVDIFASTGSVCWAVSPGKFAALCNSVWDLSVDMSANSDCSAATTYIVNLASDTNVDGDITVSCADPATCVVN